MSARGRHAAVALVVGGGSLLALALRVRLLDTWNADLRLHLVPWYDYIRAHGGFAAFKQSFSNYSPPYLYLLAAVTYVPWFPSTVAAIKSISIAFDFVAALIMWALTRQRYRAGPLPWIAYFAVLFAPTIVLNSSHWGQCDVIHASGLLACVALCCARRPVAAMLAFGAAFSVKGQAVFLAPFLLGLLLRRSIPWWSVVLVPAVYVALALPAAALGQPWADLLTGYWRQGDAFHELSMNAPNPYFFISNTHYDLGVRIGVAVGGLATVGVALALWRSRVSLDAGGLLRTATLSVALLPFVLPKMHDRYFFAADLLSIGLAFCVPRLWIVPLLFQLSSTLAYGPFLRLPVNSVRAAALINTFTVGLLLWTCLANLYPRGAVNPGAARE